MNPTTALILAALLGAVALVLVVWSAVEAVLWLEDHTKRIRALEDLLEDQILERALEETIEKIRLDPSTPNFLTPVHELEAVRRRSLAGRLEDSIRRLDALEHTLEETTITFHHHAPWSPLYDQDTAGVWADLTTAEEEV